MAEEEAEGGLQAEWDKELESAETETPEPEVAPAQEKARFSNLDEVILDDPRMPVSLRGRTAAELFADRTNGWQQAQHNGYERNSFKTQAETYQRALEIAARERGIAPAPEPQAPTRKRVDATTVYSDPEAFQNGTIEEAEARIIPKFDARASVMEQRLQQLEQERQVEQIARLNEQRRNAFLQAKPDGVSMQDWHEDAGVIAAHVLAQQLPLEDPRSYAQAGAWLNQTRSRGQRANAPSAPVTAPAPPVGGGKTAPQAPAGKGTARMSTHQRGALNTVARIFGQDAEKILAEMQDDR